MGSTPSPPPTRGPSSTRLSRWQRWLQDVRLRFSKTRVVRWLSSNRYLMMHAVAAERAPSAPDDDGLRCNHVEDLALFEQTERWLPPETFVAAAGQRIVEGLQVYTFTDGRRLLHYGWLVPRQSEAWLPYVQQRYRFPPNTAVLFNAYTHPQARGQGIHERSMRRRVADAARMPGTNWVYTAIESHNLASRTVAARVGLVCVDVLYERVRLGRVERGRMSPEDYFATIEHRSGPGG